ncbi:hypothetical protein DSO57_1000433 [Entomophthora muscae]|uniref:Uncharacterized protein n=1 Tax=Entomophthora muscae TaxID=34485 RepID=A0ACC2UJ06_9FUNG|nr:hypothetical protein DSO57_1000433 [Entomophthora muscae]
MSKREDLGSIPVLAKKMASRLDPRIFKGPGKRFKLVEGFLEPGLIKISLLLSGKVAKAFLKGPYQQAFWNCIYYSHGSNRYYHLSRQSVVVGGQVNVLPH